MTGIFGPIRSSLCGAWLGVALAGAAAVSLSLAPVATASPQGWSGAGITQAPGGPYLTDHFGRALQLHGVNLVGKCGGGSIDTNALGTPCVGPAQGAGPAFVLSPTAKDPGRRFTAADAATLASLGFNTVRLGIIWEGLEPGRAGVGPNDPVYCAPHRFGSPFPSLGAADPYDPAAVRAYLTRTDVIARLLEQVGLRVIIDMHSDDYGSAFFYATGPTPWNGEGAPAWATCFGANVPDPVTWGEGGSYPPIRTASHHFFANDVQADLQGQYARVWQAVARHYRNDPNVLGYEIYNEPADYLVHDFAAELQCDYGGPRREPKSCADAPVAALPTGLIGAIQAADPGHVVFFEPPGANLAGGRDAVAVREPMRFKDLALSFHLYGPVPPLTERERASRRTDQPGGPPWIMDEFGATRQGAPLRQSVSQTRTDGVSWTYWSGLQLDDPTAANPIESLLNQTTRRPYQAAARALAVPYPWATAGRPGVDLFNPATRTFAYRYAPDKAIRAPTEIAVPAYAYPLGYVATASGATIVSARDAAVLEVKARRRAAKVQVTVRPRPVRLGSGEVPWARVRSDEAPGASGRLR